MVMDRYEILKTMASFYGIWRPQERMTVITVVNPEELGKTRDELWENLERLFQVGFMIVLPDTRGTSA